MDEEPDIRFPSIHPSSFYRRVSNNTSFDSLEFGLNTKGPKTLKLNDLVSIVQFDEDVKQKRKKFSPFDLSELDLEKEVTSSSACLLTPPLSLRKETTHVTDKRKRPAQQPLPEEVPKDKYYIRTRSGLQYYLE